MDRLVGGGLARAVPLAVADLAGRHPLCPPEANRGQLAAGRRRWDSTSPTIITSSPPSDASPKRWADILLNLLLNRLAAGDRVLFALDDTPTKRYGPKVEGAGIHHNPTPGPADADFLYGHIWVTLALIAHHPLWGTIGLPVLGRLVHPPE